MEDWGQGIARVDGCETWEKFVDLQTLTSYNFFKFLDNETRICLYGKCFYCKSTEAVCGNRTHFIEGVLLYQVPGPILKHKSPWQRTYKEGQKALWEQNGEENYCDQVKAKLSAPRILDLIDAAIFDFLIQNGDRHHYETRKNRILLIDNGKGFGNPNADFMDILSPLHQCCMWVSWKLFWISLKSFISEFERQVTTGC